MVEEGEEEEEEEGERRGGDAVINTRQLSVGGWKCVREFE